MAHILKKEQKNYPWLVRFIFWAQRIKYGAVLEPAWFWGRSPKLLYGMQLFYRLIDRKNSPIDKQLRALLSNRISELNHCAFCSDISASALIKSGISMEKITDLSNYAKSANFTEKEKACLRFADLITISHKTLTKEEFEEVRKYFSEEEIVELIGWICFQNLSSKFNSALDISSQGFCKLP